MTAYRDQAIRDVAAAAGIDTREVRDALNWMDDENEILIAYAVAQRERVLDLEAKLQQKEDERG